MANRIFNLQGDLDPILTNLAQGYSNISFVGNKLFPEVNVSKETGKTPEFGKENLKIHDSLRGLRAEPKQIMPDSISFTDYKLEEHTLEFPIDWREAEASKELVNLENYAVRALMESLKLEQEYEISTVVKESSNYDSAHVNTLSSADDKWNDADSDPIAQLREGIEVIRKDSVRKPNVLILSATAFSSLQDHPKITSRIQSTDVKVVTEDLIASMLGTKTEPMKVYVGAASYYDPVTSGNIDLWGDSAALAYVPQTKNEIRNRYEPSFGYTFLMENYPAAKTTYDRTRLVKYVMAGMMYQAKMLNSSAGYLFTDTIG